MRDRNQFFQHRLAGMLNAGAFLLIYALLAWVHIG